LSIYQFQLNIMKLINNQAKTYFWSDQHLGHKRMYSQPFTASDNSNKPMRDFPSQEECEEYMINQYNKVVKADDKVYFLGDVVMNKKSLPILQRMKKGNKYLILGNHDDKCCITTYKKYFDKIYGCTYLNKFKVVISHFPCNDKMLRKSYESEPRFLWNIHGHTHDNYVTCTNDYGTTKVDDRYINVCVEAVNYRPISAEELGITPEYHADIIASLSVR